MTARAEPPGVVPRTATAVTKENRQPPLSRPSEQKQDPDCCGSAREKPAAPPIPRQLVGIAAEYGIDFVGNAMLVAALLRCDPARSRLDRLGLSDRDYCFREALGRLVSEERP